MICMIPVRKGSTRVPGKALRMIGSRTLLEISIEKALTYYRSSQIFLNTDWDDLLPVAESYNINFFRRADHLCRDVTTNDEFMCDFLKHMDCMRVVQLLPTSPFLSSVEFAKFCSIVENHVYSDVSIVSVGSHRIGCVDEFGDPINFERSKVNPPSQNMTAIYSYATVLMSWSKRFFLKAMDERGSAYHGNDSNIYFKLKHLSLLDIDTEEDYQEAVTLSDMIDKVRTN